ncbi:MAG: membrane protein insertion efficiency factor YidD [Candidatus Dasytiphilus stammeri]
MNLKKSLITVIYIYQKFISRLINPRCRFRPTCSQYSTEAITKFGIIKGTFLTIKRIVRCHPLNLSYEMNNPVPKKKRTTREN